MTVVAHEVELVDFAHTAAADRRRREKATAIAKQCWLAGVSPAQVPVEGRAGVCRAAGVNPPGSGETWSLAEALYQAKVAWDAPDSMRPGPGAGETPLAVAPAVPPAVHEPPLPTHAAGGTPKGWAQLAQLPVLDRQGTGCLECGGPAVVGTVDGWRCGEHPPRPGEWGYSLDWTPDRAGRYCPPAACSCGRCPSWKPHQRSVTLRSVDASGQTRTVKTRKG